MRDDMSEELLEENSVDVDDRPDPVAPTDRGGDPDEPAWRAGIRGSRFGQVAVVLVAAFAIAIAAWWAVGPEDAGPAQAETAVVTEVDVAGASTAPVAGQTAPAFTATGIDSAEVSLDPAASEGRPVWLMFVATWCTGCRTEMPDVQAAAAAYGDDVEVIVVYVGEDTATVSAYSERVGNDFTQVPDRNQTISAAYGIMGVPSHFFIGADGVVQQVHVGLLTPAQMDESLRALTGAWPSPLSPRPALVTCRDRLLWWWSSACPGRVLPARRPPLLAAGAQSVVGDEDASPRDDASYPGPTLRTFRLTLRTLR